MADRNSDAAHEVLRAIRQIVRKVSQHSKYLSREVGLTVPQLLSLKAIGELQEAGHEPITVAMIGERVQLSAATMSRVVDRLERAGLVMRERRAADRRKVCLSLTATGKQRFHTLPEPLQDKFIQRLMALDEADRAQLLNSLRRITELMEASDLDAAPILTPDADVRGES